MSTTSGEFIVQTIEKEILAYIDDQIAILPDPDLKKKKVGIETEFGLPTTLEDVFKFVKYLWFMLTNPSNL